jgi:hypothetical protein
MSWRLLFIGEYGFNGGVEDASEFECEWETRVELTGFDGVDGLAGDFEALSEVCLTPIALGAQDAEMILH